MSYDQRCYDLAEAFLNDEPSLRTDHHKDDLAQLLQTTIEDYIQYELDPNKDEEIELRLSQADDGSPEADEAS